MIEKVILNTQQSKSEEAYAFVLVEKANILAADKNLQVQLKLKMKQ